MIKEPTERSCSKHQQACVLLTVSTCPIKSQGSLANCSTIVKGLAKKTWNRPQMQLAECRWGTPGSDQRVLLLRPPSGLHCRKLIAN